MDSSIDRVIPLDELDDFKVAEGDPDVRGWDVLSSDGRKIGEVDNLLVDTGAMKVRYLDVDVDDDLGAGTPDKHVLIPIGFARLDEDSDQIFVDGLNSSAIERLPEYRRETLNRAFETSLRGHFGDRSITDMGVGAAAAGTAGAAGLDGTTTRAEPDFYGHEIYSDDRFYDARRGDPGARRVTRSEEELAIDTRQQVADEVTVNKYVEDRHISETVPTRHEEVVVERRPATSMDATPRIENESVEADLRRERIDIQREGDADVRDRDRDIF